MKESKTNIYFAPSMTFLKQSENVETGQILKTLTDEQKKEVYASYEESKEDNNLTSWEDIKKKY